MVGTTKVYSGLGADIVMESITLIDLGSALNTFVRLHRVVSQFAVDDLGGLRFWCRVLFFGNPKKSRTRPERERTPAIPVRMTAACPTNVT